MPQLKRSCGLPCWHGGQESTCHCKRRRFDPCSGKTPHCWCSVVKSRPTLGDPVDCSVPGFPVFHCLLEFAQTHVLRSCLFTSGGQSTGASASALPMNSQGWFLLGLTGLISLLSKEVSRFHTPGSNSACVPRLLSPRATATGACAPRARALQREKPHTPLAATRESLYKARKTYAAKRITK